MKAFDDRFTLAGREVSPDSPCFLIAEAGVAHFGSLEKARRLVDLAAFAGADAVKFQMFRTEELISAASPEWRQRLRTKELPLAAFGEIRDYCRLRGIAFCATAHDEPSLEALVRLDPPFYKLGSGEVRNWPFVQRVAALGKPVVLSTGMYSMDDVEQALAVVAAAGNRQLAVLHCVTLYPTPPADANLRAMDTLRTRFPGLLVGYSDHTRGFHVPLAAVARGARVLEKHLTLDYDVPDAQDWKAACGPEDFPAMVRQLREVEAALGLGHKAPGEAEQASLAWARKSLVAAVAIAEGAIITRLMLRAQRPGSGIPPAEIDTVIGRRAVVAIPAGEVLSRDQFA